MELRQTEPLRLLDDHHRGVRHVDAHFDYGGGDQDFDFAAFEAVHHILLLVRPLLPLVAHQPDAGVALLRRHYRGVELGIDGLGNPKTRHSRRHCLAVRAVRRHCIVGVRNGEDA